MIYSVVFCVWAGFSATPVCHTMHGNNGPRGQLTKIECLIAAHRLDNSAHVLGSVRGVKIRPYWSPVPQSPQSLYVCLENTASGAAENRHWYPVPSNYETYNNGVPSSP